MSRGSHSAADHCPRLLYYHSRSWIVCLTTRTKQKSAPISSAVKY